MLINLLKSPIPSFSEIGSLLFQPSCSQTGWQTEKHHWSYNLHLGRDNNDTAAAAAADDDVDDDVDDDDDDDDDGGGSDGYDD